ncbi:hypothetical protein [Ferruginibacter sp.]|nr:hypothetical protein [Ferruginibacter sp.]
MLRIIYLLAIVFVVAPGCSEKKKGTTKENETTVKKQGGSIADSYTADTLYQDLPKLLVDMSASSNIEELLPQDWILEDDKDALELASDDGSFEMPVRTLSLATDNTVIKNCRNAVEEGMWKFDNEKKTLTLKYKEGGTDVYKIRSFAADEMKLTNIGIGSETVLKFVAEGNRYKNKNDDPFYFANNKWRKRPSAPENDAAIKQRLKDNLHFFILYYKDAIARRASVVSFYGFPSCLRWYAGGIYIQDNKEQLEKWEACFYSKAQAAKALAIMEEVMAKKYTWPKGQANWIKQNLAVLEQMYGNL